MKIRTLIVDDEYLIVKSLVHILSSMTDRFEVIGTGTDGEQAYSQICSLAPDLVLLDISMPRLDGLELLKRLHDNAIPMPTVIIFCPPTETFPTRSRRCITAAASICSNPSSNASSSSS